MARSGKSRSSKDETLKAPTEDEDAVILPEEGEAPEAGPTEARDSVAEAQNDPDIEGQPVADTVSEAVEVPIEEAEGAAQDDTTQGGDDPETGPVEPAATDTDAGEPPPEVEKPATETPETPETAEPELPREPEPAPAPRKEVIVQKVGFIPLVLGGAIAAGLGFVLAFYYYGQPGSDFEALIAAQADRITELQEQVSALPTDQPDLAPISARLDEIQAAQAALTARLDESSAEITQTLAAFEERLTGIERAPGGDGTLAQTAIDSWERELDGLRAEFAAQQAAMAALTEQAQSDLEAARAEAAAVEQSAEEAAQAAVARAAMSRVQAALDSGSPFDAALADLRAAGTEVPPALAGVAADGVPTINALREEFPAAARAALSAARAEGLADEGANPLTAFLRDQLEVRSVEPRAGDDPDAILSRAEAALSDARLTDALAEIETLPEVARSAMSDWIARATVRADALAAAETLDQSLSN